MDRKQKELLYEIASWYSKDFCNQMDDHWTYANHEIADKCIAMIDRLTKEYMENYGALPEWKHIDDVWDTMRILKEELDE
jgi:hypothetical protein